ncbi:MAG TPA: ORF6N domain-containing protein [Terriglobales bacterium]|nr:ORF6N domain-containing protein [Terriglobales bacterium]
MPVPEQIEELKYLPGKCGGWIIWDEQAKSEKFVPMQNWLRLYKGKRFFFARDLICHSRLVSERVILAADLAGICGVETRALNQAVKRNRERFPEDFTFRLTREEAAVKKKFKKV